MKKLGYIVSNTKLRGAVDFVETTTDPSCLLTDKPILVVGLENARKLIENFSILRKNPSENRFWTFGKTEKRNDYERDIEKFYKYVIEKHILGIRYYYLNIIKLSFKEIKSFLSIVYSEKPKYVYIYRDMLYLYDGEYIFGVSLKILRYAGMDIERHLKKIYKIKTIKFFYDDKTINPYMKRYAKNKKYLIPFFLSLLE